MDESFMIEQLYDQVRERFDIAYWPDGLYEQTAEALKDYEKRGCFYFEDETLAHLETLDRDMVYDFTLREYTPDGWDQSGFICHTLYYAGIVCAFLPFMVAYPFLQKYFVTGVNVGAVKE